MKNELRFVLYICVRFARDLRSSIKNNKPFMDSGSHGPVSVGGFSHFKP